jgi:hypothetical protein
MASLVWLGYSTKPALSPTLHPYNAIISLLVSLLETPVHLFSRLYRTYCCIYDTYVIDSDVNTTVVYSYSTYVQQDPRFPLTDMNSVSPGYHCTKPLYILPELTRRYRNSVDFGWGLAVHSTCYAILLHQLVY